MTNVTLTKSVLQQDDVTLTAVPVSDSPVEVKRSPSSSTDTAENSPQREFLKVLVSLFQNLIQKFLIAKF